MDNDWSGCIISIIVIALIIGIIAFIIAYIDYIIGGGIYLLTIVGLFKKLSIILNKFKLSNKCMKTLFLIGISSLSISIILCLLLNLNPVLTKLYIILLFIPIFMLCSIITLQSWGKSITQNDDFDLEKLKKSHQSLEKECKELDNKSKLIKAELNNIEKNIKPKQNELEYLKNEKKDLESEIDIFLKKKQRNVDERMIRNWEHELNKENDENLNKLKLTDDNDKPIKENLLRKVKNARNQNKIWEEIGLEEQQFKKKQEEYNKLIEKKENKGIETLKVKQKLIEKENTVKDKKIIYLD